MRCQWCGNANPIGTAVCGHCQKDLLADQTVRESVEALESLQMPEPGVSCPKCGASNFIGSRFCDMCNTPLHPGARWPTKTIAAPPRVTRLPIFVRAIAAAPAVLVGAWVLSVLIGAGMVVWAAGNPSPKPVATTPVVPENTYTFEGHNDPLPPVPVKIDVDGKDSPAPRAGRPRSSSSKTSTKTSAKSSPRTQYTLPLPDRSTVLFKEHSVGSGLKTGTYKCQLPGTVYANQRYMDSSAMWKVMQAQGLRFAGGSYSWPIGESEEAMTSASLTMKSAHNSAYTIDVFLEPMRDRPPYLTLMVVQYAFPMTWTLEVE